VSPVRTNVRSLSSARKLTLAALLVVGLVSAYLSRTADSVDSVPSAGSSRPPATSGSSSSTDISATVQEPDGNSADRVIFWSKAADCAAMTDQQMDAWAGMGIDGYLCFNQVLSGGTTGGEKAPEWTGDPAADLSGAQYDLQRRLTASPLVQRAKAGKVKVYLGFYTLNYNNRQTHLSEWFDDPGWDGLTLPKVRDISGAARLLGFAGIALDLENYPQAGSWNWNYPGNTRPEAEVRAKARERGVQFMGAVLQGFPEVDLVAYGAKFPDTWDAVVQAEFRAPGFDDYVQTEFWDGISSVEGYKAIRFTGELFYKSPFPSTQWPGALSYSRNSLQAFMSQTWQNWDHASSRFFVSPAAWIDSGDGREALAPDYVLDQLAQFRTWGDGGEFYVFAYQALSGFDYRPYAEGIRQASQRGMVDSIPPTVKVKDAPLTVSGATADVSGEAADNLAVRRVTWVNDRGGQGVARMTWEPSDGPTRWSIDGLALRQGVNTVTVTVEDVKGLTASGTLRVESEGGPP